MEIFHLPIKELQKKLTQKELSSVELTRLYLDRIERLNNQLNVCLTVCNLQALKEAEEADKRRARGEEGEFLGIPYLAKDNILTRGVKTTAASRMLANYIAPFDATVIKRLKRAGAVLLGKTNLDEFAHGASTENSAFGPTRNPWDIERVPGGSSGGSAAAVAAGMGAFALGTDTGGSIRHPASFCGVVGLKPTYGRASRFGLIAMTSSTDVPGPLTRTAEDAALTLSVIAGPDKKDSTVASKPLVDYHTLSLEGLRVGLPREYFIGGLDPEVQEAIESAKKVWEKLGVKFKEVSLPHTKYAVSVYYIITPAEISSNLARFDGIRYGFSSPEAKNLEEEYLKSRGQGFGPEVKRRIMLGTYTLSAGYFDAYYRKAQQVRTLISRDFAQAFKEVDCLLTPTTPHPAFLLGKQVNDPLK
ncbi:Asp-tRNA(Asn)/Glu-tRNA(Gln) amidotransferase subunit GatA, partial [Candidatus Parcubacteria bacterium]